MTPASLAMKCRDALLHSRISPVSPVAIALTFVLIAVGPSASVATGFTLASLPNVLPLLLGIVALDIVCSLVPQTKLVERIQTFIYGVLYLVVTILCGILAAYAMQRFAFPLRDELLMRWDHAFGFNWIDFARWVDRQPDLQKILIFAYHTIGLQIALPLAVLSFAGRKTEVRRYILTFAIAFTVTIFISATMPAAGPVIFYDRDSFDILRFTGATPLDHLVRLREAGPLVMFDPPGGIATFPSFHATIAVLTPLMLWRYRPTFVALLVLDGFMLVGTITEGAHYLVDLFAGAAVAAFAFAVASRIIRVGDERDASSAIPALQPAE